MMLYKKELIVYMAVVNFPAKFDFLGFLFIFKIFRNSELQVQSVSDAS